MRLPSEIFCTVLLLIFARKSKADIPDCNYYDTVDISNVERQNDSYLYDDIPIPASLTGDYEYKMVVRLTIPAKRHLRACVCKLWPCIRICCPAKYTLANGKCGDGLQEELARLKSYIYLTSATNLSTKTRVPLTEMAIIRDQFLDCDEMVHLTDEFTYVENGSLYISDAWSLEKQDYCLYPYQFNSDFPNSMWIVKHSCISYIYPGSLEIGTISLICYILTIIVYLYIKELRNVTGKCIICCMISLFIQYLIIILDDMKVLNTICSLAGYSGYFFWMTSHLWLSVISYQLWKLLTSLNRAEPTYRFQLYSAFVWTTAAVMTGSIYMVNLIWENDLNKWNWLPLVGFIDCSVKDWNSSSWMYSTGPLLVLSTFNIAMFTLTVIYIRKVKREIKKFAHEEEGRIGCINFDSQTYLQFLRLSVVMGLTWIVDVIPFSARFNIVWSQIIMISDYYNYAFGIVIFVVLVLKRSTLTLLIKS
ncbi:probable G-protein coupled receptor Mth-like 7 [Drosophila teissieri]|uniref:probable G-protein coupled receptor Mth-like 7 n=1 Tax=Drosophila teissieri TaxID=7243 RepID=UPI001CB9DA36|nr:probable G-protein coupled receptor Mth-like 7 [Drosophila teissieri]